MFDFSTLNSFDPIIYNGYLGLSAARTLSRTTRFVPVPIPIVVPLQTPTLIIPLEHQHRYHHRSIFPTEYSTDLPITEEPDLIYDIRRSSGHSLDNPYPRSIFEDRYQYGSEIEPFNLPHSTLINITDFSILENPRIEPFDLQPNRIITYEMEQTFWGHDEDIVIQDRAITEPELCRREFVEGIIYGTIGRLNDFDIISAIGTSTTETPSISPLQLSYRRNDPALALVIEFRLLLDEIIDNSWDFEDINFPEMQQQAITAAIDKNIKKLLKIINKTRALISQQNEIETPSLEIISEAIMNGDFERAHDLITIGISNELMSEILLVAFDTIQQQETSYSVVACNIDDIIKLLLTRGAELNLAIVCNLIIGGSRNVASYLDILFQHYPEFTIDTIVPGGALTLLIMAVIDRNIDAVKILIEKGADINQPGSDGLTPLMHAIRTQQLDIVDLLLQEKTLDVNVIVAGDESALTIAASITHRNIVNIIDSLLKRGANVNHTNIRGFSPIIIATINGNDLAVSRLIQERNIELNQPFGTDQYIALNFAIENDYTEMALELIARGANINHISAEGYSILMQAILKKNKKVIMALLENEELEINYALEENGYTALTLAAINNYDDIAEILITSDADVHQRDKKGFTPLMHAANIGNLEAAWAIAENSELTIKELEKAKIIAQKRKHGKIVAILDNKILKVQMDSVSITKAIFNFFSGEK